MSKFEAEKVEWLLANRLPCRGCHVVGGAGGQVGPDLDSVSNRLSAEAIADQILNPQHRNPHSIMPKVHMPPAWLRSLVTYLNRRAGSGQFGPTVAVGQVTHPLSSDDGALLYGRLCAVCHGARGVGDGPNARFLAVKPARHADAARMSLHTDDWLFDTIASGGYPMNRNPSMPPYGASLDARSIRALVKHVRVLCQCSGPAWSRDGRLRPSH